MTQDAFVTLDCGLSKKQYSFLTQFIYSEDIESIGFNSGFLIEEYEIIAI